jgi:hypothetical protein
MRCSKGPRVEGPGWVTKDGICCNFDDTAGVCSHSSLKHTSPLSYAECRICLLQALQSLPEFRHYYIRCGQRLHNTRTRHWLLASRSLVYEKAEQAREGVSCGLFFMITFHTVYFLCLSWLSFPLFTSLSRLMILSQLVSFLRIHEISHTILVFTAGKQPLFHTKINIRKIKVN